MADLATREVEHWRSAVGFEGEYEVSDLGRVRSLDRWSERAIGKGPTPERLCRTFVRGRVLRPGLSSNGYLTDPEQDFVSKVLAHIRAQEEEIGRLKDDLDELRDSLSAKVTHGLRDPTQRAEIAEREWAETKGRLASLVEAAKTACDNLDALDSETKDRDSGAFAIKIGRSLSEALAEAESLTRTEPPLSDGVARDLALMIKRMARLLKRRAQDALELDAMAMNGLADAGIKLLVKHGLEGSPFRSLQAPSPPLSDGGG